MARIAAVAIKYPFPRIGGMPTTFRLPSGAIPISIDAQSRIHQLYLVGRAEGQQIVDAQLARGRIPFGEAFEQERAVGPTVVLGFG